MTISSAATLGQSGPGSDCNEVVLHSTFSKGQALPKLHDNIL